MRRHTLKLQTYVRMLLGKCRREMKREGLRDKERNRIIREHQAIAADVKKAVEKAVIWLNTSEGKKTLKTFLPEVKVRGGHLALLAPANAHFDTGALP